MRVQINKITVDNEVYPRDSHDNATVLRYRQALDLLPPIKISHESILIDGYHRLLAHQVEGKKEIEAETLEVSRENILVEAIRLNARHGRQLSSKEKNRHARTLWEQQATGPKDPDTAEWIADLLSITKRSVYTATQSIRKEQKENQKEDAWHMWLACNSQAEIAEALGISQDTVSKWVLQISESFRKSVPDSLQLYDVWSFGGCDERYGVSGYPGRIPGQIVENVLYYYTQPGAIVLDPMAGGGTVIDVCKAMGRRYLAYDIEPIRDDIARHDIATGAPQLPTTVTASGGVKLIFADPPYWTMKADDYSTDSVSNRPLHEFNTWLTQLGNIVLQILGDGGIFAFLIQNQTEKDVPDGQGYIDHALEAYGRFLNSGFVPIRRIACPQSTQTFTPQQVEKAKENLHLMGITRDLLIMRKGRV